MLRVKAVTHDSPPAAAIPKANCVCVITERVRATPVQDVLDKLSRLERLQIARQVADIVARIHLKKATVADLCLERILVSFHFFFVVSVVRESP